MSNLDSAYLQPFKNITLTMANPTNDGVFIPKQGESVNQWRLKGDLKYSAVHIDSNGNGRVACQLDGYTKGNPIVGVLLESFSHAKVPTKICVTGIVPMPIDSAIKPGDKVTVLIPQGGAGDTHTIVKAATGDYAFGTALTKGEVRGDYVAVLIGTGGKL